MFTSANTCCSIAPAILSQLSTSLLWIFIVLYTVFPCNGLRLTNMSAPKIIDYREDMDLDCHFDMGDEELYAVKWYKDDHEFFRYMPHQQPYVMSFPVPGVYLEKHGSNCGQNRCHVRLSNLVRAESSGAYRCEVSSEAPAFRLASETHNVTVAALPKEQPIIEGLDESYFVGDILTAKCISPYTDPPQHLTWYINKEQVPERFTRDMKLSRADGQGLTSRSLHIRFTIEKKYSKGASIELTCVSSFSGISQSALTAVKSISLFDHDNQVINNQKYSWYSSSVAYVCNTHLIVLLSAIRWCLV